MFAEPDLEQTSALDESKPSGPGYCRLGDAAPANHDVYATGNTNLWFVDEAHSQLEEKRGRASQRPDPTASPRDVIRIAHLDTGYDDNHATRPRFPEQGPCNAISSMRPAERCQRPDQRR